MSDSGPVFYGWRVVAAGFVIACFAWSLGLFGGSVYLQALTSTHGWSVTQVSSAITVFFFVSASVQRGVGLGIDRLGPRPVLAAGAVSMTSGVALLGQISHPWQLFPCFVLIGLGWSTLSTTGLSATVAPWFERHQGRSITLAVMGASVGAIIGVPLLLTALSRFGLSTGFAIVAVVSASVLLPLILRVLRFRNPGQLGLQRDGDIPGAGKTPPAMLAPIANEENRRRLLASVATGFALGLLVQIGFITHHVALSRPVLGVAGAGLLVSATGLTAFTGRLVLARMIDRIDARRLGSAVMLVQTVTLTAMALAPHPYVLIGASLVYGFGIGYITTLGPIVVRREFGAASFGANYGSAATVIQFTSACGPALLGWLSDIQGGYRGGLLIFAVISLTGSAALFFGRRASDSA